MSAESDSPILSTSVVSVDVSKNSGSSDISLQLSGTEGPLVTIKHDGTVIAEKLEDCSEAGKVFVAAIRCQLGVLNFPSNATNNDDFLNKTEDLHLLSKIVDAYLDGDGITECVQLIHAARKADRDKIEELQKLLK